MKIKTIKKINNKYKIILENNEIITTYDEIIIKKNILYKKELTEEIIKEINEENEYYDSYNKILKYINTKLRSKQEIIEYMKKQEIEKEYQTKIIERLQNNNLINDEIYAKAYIHDKISFSNDGPNKIKKELLRQKIDETIIDIELEKIDKEIINKKLKKQVEKKINNNTKYSNNMLKQKLIMYFVNLGYDKSEIMNYIENKKENNIEIIEKEYNKIYNKYKNKYDEYKLKQTIKQKLYQKGFEMDEINEIINKKR